MINTDEPVVAVCGFSGAGKTTLLEAAIPLLEARGLAVAVVKHDAHGLQIDHPHKDSGRLFAAGADVGLSGPGEEVLRRHQSGPPQLAAMLRRLLAEHDVVLVEGHKATPLPKVWLPNAEAIEAPEGVTEVIATLPTDEHRLPRFVELCLARVHGALKHRKVFAGILMGGRSRRMGRPKQLVEIAGRPMIERIARVLAPALGEPVLLGNGALPEALASLPRLADPPGIEGPLAGIVAALRWAPRTTWLIAACDLPDLSPEALSWLLDQRTPGRWMVLPELEPGRIEPLLALYEPQALALLERALDAGHLAPRAVADHPHAHRPRVPEELRGAWQNVNTPEELHEATRSLESDDAGLGSP